MEYLSSKNYIIAPLFRGDIKEIRKKVKNPVTNEPYSYSTVLKVLQGIRNNDLILNYAKELVAKRKELMPEIAKLSA